MENFKPSAEKNPAARMMSLAEKMDFFNALVNLRQDGKGDETINFLYEQLSYELGKVGGSGPDKSSSGDDQESE